MTETGFRNEFGVLRVPKVPKVEELGVLRLAICVQGSAKSRGGSFGRASLGK